MAIENRAEKFEELRAHFKEFTYLSFDYRVDEEGMNISFHFQIDDFVDFRPRLMIPGQEFIDFNRISSDLLSQMVFNIGMVELISYWKAICPSRIKILPYHLNEDQISFWKKIYFHGLGEFFYLNGISVGMENFVSLYCDENAPEMASQRLEVEDAALIPVGGGKDSVVSLEILKNQANHLALIMNPRGASSATANIAGYKGKTFGVKRFLDKKLLELNAQGYLNGHTPFSALLAFVSVLAAALSGKKYIALSNESSANESTVVGTMVNHQYSKSLEFESDFRAYSKKYLCPDIEYFSLLRPLSELQIASIFAKNSDYFMDFRSCNVGSKTDSWCGKCSKCLFTFIILSPFVEPEVLIEIFGFNLLDDSGLKLYFEELTGIAEVKPFECVGTVEEVNAALCLSMDFYPEKLPYLLQYFKEVKGEAYCLPLDKKSLMENIEEEHYLEEKFLRLLKNKI